MKSEVHIVWRRPSPDKAPVWMILYANGKTSRIKSPVREGVIGLALSLGRVVVVHRENGAIDFVLPAENRSRFNFLMLAIAFSFLAIVTGAVWFVIWLARQF